LLFPHFAAGGGMTSEITLVNPTSLDVSAYLRSFNQDGSETKDLVDGFAIVVPARGSRIIPVNASSPRVGYIDVQAGPSNSSLLVGTLKITMPGIGTSAIQPGLIGQTFVLPAKKDAAGSTAIAVVNFCQIPLTIQLQLRNADGLSLGAISIPLPSFAQFARYVDELIPRGQNYSGATLTVSGISPGQNCKDISVISFELGSQPGQFVVVPVGRIN
jgi:hypothetical protein